MSAPFRIATRGSPLARWQAEHVAELLRPLLATRSVELVEIHTTGDRVQNDSLAVIGGQGVFTREIQQAVLDGEADLAVHSLKDLPTAAQPGLVVAAVPERGATADAFLSYSVERFDDLPAGAQVATGSSRRRAQLLVRRPDLKLVDIRGNVDTRLRKLRGQGLDGLVLACAGLERLGLQGHITEVLDWMLPAVGQGALGLECRAGDHHVRQVVEKLNHAPSCQAVLAERAFLRALGGGCLLPIAARARVQSERLTLEGAVFSSDGRTCLREVREAPVGLAEEVGQQLAVTLLAQGARQLLAPM